LAFTLNALSLAAGLENGTINLYSLTTHQLLKTITTHKGQPITYLKALLKPPDVLGHISFGNPSASKDAIPLRPVLPFQRIRDPKARSSHEVMMKLPTFDVVQFLQHIYQCYSFLIFFI
jgi:pre-rRNA-processing protein IPI3